MIPAFELTLAEQAGADRMLAELRANGYQPLERLGLLQPGARIRHRGHQWIDALTDGSGYVVTLVEKPDSPWSKDWGGPDIELVAVWDRAPFDDMSRLSQVANYHVIAISEQWAGGERRA